MPYQDDFSEEWKSKVIRKQELIAELQEIEADFANRNCTNQGNRRLDSKAYWQWKHRKVERKAEIAKEIRELKLWFTNNNKPPHHVVIRKDPVLATTPGTLTEFDLQNALMEPQELIRLSFSALTTLTSKLGRSESHRALLDSMADYMRRHAMII